MSTGPQQLGEPGNGADPAARARPQILGIPLGVLLLFLVFANLMLAFPQLDLALSRQFYTPGIGFAALGQPWERLLYHSVEVLMVVINLGLIALWLTNRLGGRRRLRFDGRKLGFLLCLLALLPGLLVNQIFKENWGRARPVKVEQFGGVQPYSPPFVLTGRHGGSFSSGHAAAACWLVAVSAVLFGPRSAWVWVTALYAALVGLARIAAGGHFLSDVVASAFFVAFGYFLLRRLFFGEGGLPSPR